jgi:dihydropteroate synthase
MDTVKSPILYWPKGSLDFSQGCLIMGILNVTPDSFSDGGEFFELGRAVDHGMEMVRDGAAIIDIGGESTRPGAKPMPPAEQIGRVVPVIETLAERTNVPISIDTHDVEVARAALDAGASIINDITALADERMTELAAQQNVPVVLMHMQGTPATMQVEPTYADAVTEVRDFLVERANRAANAGISQERIFIDPGIGFGKTLHHNLLLLKNLDHLVATGYRVLVGPSRKAFIGKLTGRQTPTDRVFGTTAAVSWCAAAGASIVRVHDIAAMRDVLVVTQAILSASDP